VSTARRLGVAGAGLLRSWRARLMHPPSPADRRFGVA
jgi:transposase-like protein